MTGFAASFGPDSQRSAQKFRGRPHVFGPKLTHLPTLTIGMLGMSMFWSVEMSYASPYLLSLGLSKSSMAAVFVAGPLSGLVVQPLMGALADNSTSRFGRRRPYMLLGTSVCVVAMLLLGFTKGVAAVFTGWNNTVVSLSLQSPPFRV
jgi:solute carrier family 45, member 1/2/4